MIIESELMNAKDILAQCRLQRVPAKTRVWAAIKAHKIARQGLAKFAIRAVLLARTPTVEDEQQQIEYLAGLPVDAWPPTKNETAEHVRNLTLGGMRSNLAFRQSV
jgi:hypothetical protein